jgi:hypothetical protein
MHRSLVDLNLLLLKCGVQIFNFVEMLIYETTFLICACGSMHYQDHYNVPASANFVKFKPSSYPQRKVHCTITDFMTLDIGKVVSNTYMNEFSLSTLIHLIS